MQHATQDSVLMEEVPASVGRRILSGLIDGFIVLLLVWISSFRPIPFFAGWFYSWQPLSFLILLALWRFAGILLFQGSPGMHLLGLIFSRGDSQHLNFKEKLMAAFFILYRGIDYYKR